MIMVDAIESCVPFWERLGFTKTAEVPEGDVLGFVILAKDNIEVMYQTHESVQKDAAGLVPRANGHGAGFFIEVTDIEAIEKGKDPKATIRDPKINARVMLPVAERKPLLEGLSIAELLRDPDLRSRLGDYIFQAGQPQEIRQAFLAAMGVNESEIAPLAGPVDILAPPEKRARQSG